MSNTDHPTSPGGESRKSVRAPRKLSKDGKSLYVLLGIEKEATPDDIRKAYRKLALRCHPDKNPNDPLAGEKFAELNKAHTILTDESKKEIYDNYGSFGIFMSEQMGEESAKMYMTLKNPCLRCLIITCFLFTGCCCCCCCCFCCACFRKMPEEDAFEDLDGSGVESGNNEPVTCQPMPLTYEGTGNTFRNSSVK